MSTLESMYPKRSFFDNLNHVLDLPTSKLIEELKSDKNQEVESGGSFIPLTGTIVIHHRLDRNFIALCHIQV